MPAVIDACNLIEPRDDAEFIEACERAHVIDHGAVATARKAEPYRVLYLGRGEEIVTCGMALALADFERTVAVRDGARNSSECQWRAKRIAILRMRPWR